MNVPQVGWLLAGGSVAILFLSTLHAWWELNLMAKALKRERSMYAAHKAEWEKLLAEQKEFFRQLAAGYSDELERWIAFEKLAVLQERMRPDEAPERDALWAKVTTQQRTLLLMLWKEDSK